MLSFCLRDLFVYLLFYIVIDLLLSSNLSRFCNCINIRVLFIKLQTLPLLSVSLLQTTKFI